MSTKKEYPLQQITSTKKVISTIEKIIKEAKYKNLDLSKPDDISIKILDTDHNSSFYFSFSSFIRDSKVYFSVHKKPGDENSIKESANNLNETATIENFNNWLSLLERYDQTNEEKEDTQGIEIEDVKPSIRNNYWLLKMNPNTWIENNLNVGVATFFNTFHYGIQRPEFELFKFIQTGDLVIGYLTGDVQGAGYIMEVTDSVGLNTKQGEGFNMVIIKKIKPVIPRSKIKLLILDILAKPTENQIVPELLFEISNSIYDSILSMEIGLHSEYKNNYLPSFLTEGDHAKTQDQLDFENDINSFASVITLEKVKPPLAIGLFGNWGSGKSFFMEKLYEKIQRCTETKEKDHVSNIVQVRFNSWHYSDSNLWASLTTQIFESLNDFATKKQFGAEAIKGIYKKLNIANQQLEETQKKLDANAKQADNLQDKKTSIEKEISAKKETLKNWAPKDLVRVVFSDPYIQQDFKNIKDQFKNQNLIDNIDQIEVKLTEFETSRGKISESLTLLKKNHSKAWLWIWILAGAFTIIALLTIGPLRLEIQKFINAGVLITGLIVTWLANFAARLEPYFNMIGQFYDRIKSLKERIEAEKERLKLKEEDEVTQLKNEIEILDHERRALILEQSKIEEKKVELETQLNEIASGKLLANFLSDKSSDEAYIKQLGIISWVRKDFKELDEIFEKQRTALAEDREFPVEVQIDRIVLYIDDLDRCNEDVVVKVLEAIHLLLAFSLFVVIVGVDPRWLNNALTKKYKNLFGGTRNKKLKNTVHDGKDVKGSKEDISIFSGEATSYDYLEKIFQIPFALKPINKTGREKLIQYLIRDEMDADQSVSNVQANNSVSNDALKTDSNDATSIQLESSAKKDDMDISHFPPAEKITNEESAKTKLLFTTGELAYMQKISLLFGKTPRTINRYVNIYRIIKAHGNLKVEGDFSKEQFMPILFILGVIVGYSQYAQEFIDAISKSEDSTLFNDFLAIATFNEKMKEAIKPYSVEIEQLSMENFKRNVELISRFSFRTLLREPYVV